MTCRINKDSKGAGAEVGGSLKAVYTPLKVGNLRFTMAAICA